MTRIIAGQARGRSITVPEKGTRPTSDRAREGLFSSLSVRWGFEGSRVLDLFAGSGALGLEAASRGAEEVHVVDPRVQSIDHSTHLAQVVGHPGVLLQSMKVGDYQAGGPQGHFALALADPPYDFDDVDGLIPTHRPCLSERAIVVKQRPPDS